MSPIRSLAAQALALAACCLLLSACSSNSQITHSYVDPKLKELDLHGVLVVAVTKQPAARIDFEDSFVKALQKHDINAVASHTLVPGQKAEAEHMLAAAEYYTQEREIDHWQIDVIAVEGKINTHPKINHFESAI